jgi:hypothetical protein
VAKKITSGNGKAEWVWEDANFAWELGPTPSDAGEISHEDDRGIVIMVYVDSTIKTGYQRLRLFSLEITTCLT